MTKPETQRPWVFTACSAVAVAVSATVTLALVSSHAVAQPGGVPGGEEGRRHFLEVAKVLQSPRCQNCHPVGDAPLQGDQGAPHRMNISRRSVEAGLPCTSCHREANGPGLGTPPGVPGWHMPARDMPLIFEGRSPRELCEQLKDPAHNGNRSLPQLAEHMATDPLVLWGWRPGGGRSVPPLSHAAFVEHVEGWVRAGAPCP